MARCFNVYRYLPVSNELSHLSLETSMEKTGCTSEKSYLLCLCHYNVKFHELKSIPRTITLPLNTSLRMPSSYPTLTALNYKLYWLGASWRAADRMQGVLTKHKTQKHLHRTQKKQTTKGVHRLQSIRKAHPTQI